jgi:alkylation response protein AidB-like acyl-CoA dehydrogenase
VFKDYDRIAGLTSSGIEVLIFNILPVYIERMYEDEEQMRQIAEAIRQGQKVPLFALGEAGASAADRLAQQFASQRERAEQLRSRLESDEDEDDQ